MKKEAVMNRLKKSLLLSSLILAAIAADTSFYSAVYAQSSEAKELNRKGVLALESGRFDEAVQLLKQAMALEPKWGEPSYNASRLLRIKGKREEMIKMLRKANGIEPDNPKYLEEYLKALTEEYQLADKKSDTAEKDKIRAEILRINPGNVVMGLEETKKLLNLGNKDEAFAQAEKTLSKNTRLRTDYEQKEMGELYYIAAQLAEERGDLDKVKTYADYAFRYEFDKKNDAKALLSKAKDNLNQKVKDLISQAESAQRSRNYDKAKKLLEQAGEIQPENEEIKNKIVEFEDDAIVNQKLEAVDKANRDGYWLEAREGLIELSKKFVENDKIKKRLDEIKPKEDQLLKQIGLGTIPLTSRERKQVLLGFKDRGIKFLEGDVIEKDKKDKAVKSFNKALAIAKADKRLNNEIDDIESYLKKVETSDKNDENWQKALTARNAGDYEDVLKLLKKVPEEIDIQYYSYLAEAYYNTGNIEEADRCAKVQLGKQAENNRAKFILGNIKLDAGDYDNAYYYFSQVYESDPDYPEIRDKLAKSSPTFLVPVLVFLVLGLLIWVAWVMKKKMPIYDKDAKIRKAKSLFKHNCYDEAIDVLLSVRHSTYLTPSDTLEVTRLFAQCYLKKGAYDRAIGECKHLITLAPKNEEAHTWLGYAYLGQRMTSPDALPELLNLYKKDSRNIALVSLLGSYYAQQKNLNEEGVGILEQWLNLDHDNVEVLKPLGKHYLKKNRSDDKAMKVFHRMMEIGSPDPDFMLGVANVYLKTRQFDDCLSLCEHVINMDINNQYVHSILLDAYKFQNRLPELLDIYANFLQNNPYNVAFQNGLKAAQAAYEKVQRWNAAQAANEAAAVMQKLNASQEKIMDPQQMDSEQTDIPNTGEETPALAEGEIPCPQCGKGNPQNAYNCQYCGASMF